MANKDPFSLLDHAKGVRIQDIVGFVKLGITFAPGKLWKRRHPDIWVVSEYADDARDNGYWFFRYLREQHPEIEAYYPIHRNSSDYKKLIGLSNVVEFGSIKHYLLFWASHIYAGTTKMDGFPSVLSCDFLHIRGLTSFKYVFLNHGVARGYSEITDGNRTNYEALIAISKREKETIVTLNNQPEEKVHAIGFCRHDNLDDKLLEKNLILYMPTWRTWLDVTKARKKKDRERMVQEYLSSEYYQNCQGLINNPKLIRYLEDNNLHFILYLHEHAQEYSQYLTSSTKNITIAHKEDYFVQDLLKRAAFLITDYSSIIFDYAYMKKPCCYFQYDAEQFAREQYAESEFFSYEHDGFGPIYTTQDQVINAIVASHAEGFLMDKKYRQRVEEYFPSFDKQHCQRTYELIRQL